MSATARSNTLDSIMTREVITVDEDTTLYEIQGRFREGRFRHIFVTNADGALIGVLSDRDLLKATSPFFDTPTESPRDVQALMKKAGEVISHQPITAQTDTTVKEAARKLLKEGISCLPVLTPEGAIAGIVTSSDIMRYTAEQ